MCFIKGAPARGDAASASATAVRFDIGKYGVEDDLGGECLFWSSREENDDDGGQGCGRRRLVVGEGCFFLFLFF